MAASSWLGAAEGPGWREHPVNRWVRQSPREGRPAPGFLYEGSGDYDPVSRQWIHHAGHDGVPQGFHTFTFDLESGAWEQRLPPTSPPGVCCVDGGHVFDVAQQRFVRFPGGTLGHGYQWSRGVRLKDSAVWLYDPAARTWTNMRPPPYQEPPKYSRDVIGGLCSGAAYDPNHELTLSFGGTGAGGAKSALFAYDAYANALYHLPAENAPPYRDGMGLTYDAGHDCLVMFGSQYLDDERTWIYRFRTNRWEAHDLTPRPPCVKTGVYATIPRLAYDPLHGVILGVIWKDKDGHETWSFDTGRLRWTKLAPPASPGPSRSRSRNLGFSAEHNLFLLETSTADNKPEIWSYRYAAPPVDPRPAAPTRLEVTTERGAATLTWAPTPGVREYQLFRAQAEEPWKTDFTRIASVDGTRFADTGLTPGRVYWYQVKAVGRDGTVGLPSFRARTQPRVPLTPVVSVMAADQVEVRWNRHPARDVAGYNLYRGVVAVATVQKGTPAAWKDNDPAYAEPQVVKVTDITAIRKLNERPLTETRFLDRVDLRRKVPEAGDYRHAVYAYIVRAVNRLGTESGPSPYALTLPSEPLSLLCREDGATAELKWEAGPEKGIAGYHVYTMGEGVFDILRVTETPIPGTRFRHQPQRGKTRYWVTAVDALGQEGQPSSPAWFGQSFKGFYQGDWHP